MTRLSMPSAGSSRGATRSLRVLHVNVRLSEGGAALVARTLVDQQRKAGLESRFAYGYGAGGRVSPIEGAYGATRIGNRATAAANIVAHQYLGSELFDVRVGARRSFANDLGWADLVHIHVIHSYFLRPDRLLEQLGELGKPVVWTLHDQWSMTGRCAQPSGCVRWMEGCGSCPDMKAYPEAAIDHSARIWERRRSSIEKLSARVPLALVACAQWLEAAAREAGLPGTRVIQNSVDTEFWQVIQDTEAPMRSPGALFMCRDLRDTQKVDWPTLTAIGSRVALTIVGDNPPEDGPNAQRIPATTDRSQIARLMLSHSMLVFTSTVDYYPLTVIEALAAGMWVHALESSAANELRGHPAMRIYPTREALVEGVASHTQADPPLAGADAVDPARMADQYSALYMELVSS